MYNAKTIRGEKLVFNVENRPELARAILCRLEELGLESDPRNDEKVDGEDFTHRNVSVGWKGRGVAHVGYAGFSTGFWDDYQVCTLDELYAPRGAHSPPQLVFDVRGKRDLAEAITSRLEELGFSLGAGRPFEADTANLSTGYCAPGEIDCGPADPTLSGPFAYFRLLTLNDLYDVDSMEDL